MAKERRRRSSHGQNLRRHLVAESPPINDENPRIVLDFFSPVIRELSARARQGSLVLSRRRSGRRCFARSERSTLSSDLDHSAASSLPRLGAGSVIERG